MSSNTLADPPAGRAGAQGRWLRPLAGVTEQPGPQQDNAAPARPPAGQARVPAGAAGAVAAARAELAWLAGVDASGLSAAEQADCLRALEQAQAVLTAARSTVLAAFSSGCGYADDGHGSAKTWLRWRTRVTSGAAAGAVGWMRRLAAHPRVGRALAAGQISCSWARQLCAWIQLLPESAQDGAEQILVSAAAAGADLADLAALAEEIRARTAAPDADGDGDGFTGRGLRLGVTFRGAGRLEGDLSAGCAAALSAVLEALGKRVGPEDLRTRQQRDHDALEEACRRLVAAGGLLGRAGQPTHIMLHMTLDQLRGLDGAGAAEAAWASRWPAAVPGADCDATIVPVVSGHPDPDVLARLAEQFRRRTGKPAHDGPGSGPANGPAAGHAEPGPDPNGRPCLSGPRGPAGPHVRPDGLSRAGTPPRCQAPPSCQAPPGCQGQPGCEAPPGCQGPPGCEAPPGCQGPPGCQAPPGCEAPSGPGSLPGRHASPGGGSAPDRCGDRPDQGTWAGGRGSSPGPRDDLDDGAGGAGWRASPPPDAAVGQDAAAATSQRAARAAAEMILGRAADLMSGPAGLAAYLRTRLLGGPAASVSLPLDIGAATETIPAHLRRAVTARDQHCRFPGCEQPATVCQPHHLIPRSQNGATSLANLLALCSFHHLTAVHRWGWSIILNPDGTTAATSPDRTRTYHSHPSPPTRAA